jgi:hypothetical protein
MIGPIALAALTLLTLPSPPALHQKAISPRATPFTPALVSTRIPTRLADIAASRVETTDDGTRSLVWLTGLLAWVTGGLVAVTAAYVLVTYGILKANREMVAVTQSMVAVAQSQIDASLRPYITVRILVERPPIFHLRIANDG